jgi:hypothetical protein
VKNSEIEPLRKSRIRARRVALADSPYGLYVAARKGETPAVNAMLNVMDRRARYAGIDAPTKTETALHGKAGAPPISTQEIDDAAQSFQHKLLKTVAS